MMYEVEKLIANLADRISENYKIIEENAFILGEGHEITQRISTLTALLTICVGKFEDELQEIRYDKEKQQKRYDINSASFVKMKELIEELRQQKRFFSNYGDLATPEGLFDESVVIPFILHLRNSLAHGGAGLSFYPVDLGNVNEITDIYLRDTYNSSIFCVKLSVLPYVRMVNNEQIEENDHLTQLIENISAIFVGREKSENGGRIAAQYKREIAQLDIVLENGDIGAKEYLSWHKQIQGQKRDSFKR